MLIDRYSLIEQSLYLIVQSLLVSLIQDQEIYSNKTVNLCFMPVNGGIF